MGLLDHLIAHHLTACCLGLWALAHVLHREREPLPVRIERWVSFLKRLPLDLDEGAANWRFLYPEPQEQAEWA